MPRGVAKAGFEGSVKPGEVGKPGIKSDIRDARRAQTEGAGGPITAAAVQQIGGRDAETTADSAIDMGGRSLADCHQCADATTQDVVVLQGPTQPDGRLLAVVLLGSSLRGLHQRQQDQHLLDDSQVDGWQGRDEIGQA